MNDDLMTPSQKMRGWGTVLDFQSKIPMTRIGSFDQAWGDDIETFNKMSNKEKWITAYWIERKALKYGLSLGIWFGIVIGVVLFGIYQIIFG